MAANQDTLATVEVTTPPDHGEAHGDPSIIDLSAKLAVWTWVTFALVAVLLHKFAWKPILAGLDQREGTIRKSIEDAEKVREEMARLGETQRRMLEEADEQAKETLARARKGAGEAARVIESKAREEAKILLENAQREIHAARDKASAQLKRESAELAVQLTSKLIGENLDDERNRKLTEKLILEI